MMREEAIRNAVDRTREEDGEEAGDKLCSSS